MYIETSVHRKLKLSRDLTTKINYFGHFYQILDIFVVKKASRKVDFEVTS